MLNRTLIAMLLTSWSATAQVEFPQMPVVPPVSGAATLVAPPMQPLMPAAFQQPMALPAPKPVDTAPADAFFLDPAPPPARLWKGTFEAGLNGATGNAETLNVRGFASGDRTTADNILHTDVTYLLGSQNGRTVQNTVIANLRDEILFTGSPWSVYTSAFYDYDEFRQYKSLIGLYGGLAYRVIDTDDLFFKLRAGAGTIYKTGGDPPLKDRWDPSLNFGWDYRYQLSARGAFVSTLDYYPSFKSFDTFLLRFRAAYEQTIDPETGMFFRIGIFERYDSNPGPGTNRSDLNYFLALGFNL
jgi:hypothetical protein